MLRCVQNLYHAASCAANATASPDDRGCSFSDDGSADLEASNLEDLCGGATVGEVDGERGCDAFLVEEGWATLVATDRVVCSTVDAEEVAAARL